MPIHSNPVTPNLPATPHPLPATPGRGAPQTARTTVAQERAARQSAQATRGAGSTHAAGTSTSARGELPLSGAEGERVGREDQEHSEAKGNAGLVAGFDRVEGRSRPSDGSQRNQPDKESTPHDSGKPDDREVSEQTITSNDVRGVFAAPGRNAEEDLVRELARKLDAMQGNRIKRKFELILSMAQAGAKQDRSWLAMCEESLRDVDTQFDVLERGLQMKLREAKQAIAARQVSAGATASYLIIAADQHDRRQARQRLERQRDAIRQMVLKASSAPGAMNVMPLLGLLQALCLDAEQAIEMQGEYLPGRGEVRSTAELAAIDARRAKTNQTIVDAWRQASELNAAGMVGMFAEMRQSIEQRFEQQRDHVSSV